eukprot:gnl/Spiro4/9881_TR5238_c0_g1_i1.p1 gnl/Spiro4/9881_TR5238_c0_g1~~gnl/Spiro4/9881_TR5238_c0_g1_i1.p1  ORF type:complete len:1463 (+),score=469.28 gnl/Spiro4/9881_TR5238_c0_g1_i1:70-4458(+)
MDVHPHENEGHRESVVISVADVELGSMPVPRSPSSGSPVPPRTRKEQEQISAAERAAKTLEDMGPVPVFDPNESIQYGFSVHKGVMWRKPWFPENANEAKDVIPWHTEFLNQPSIGGVAGFAKNVLKTDVEVGLTGEDFSDREAAFGTNVPFRKPSKPFLEYMLDGCQDTILQILMLCAAVDLVLSLSLEPDKSVAWIDGVAIFVAILIVLLVVATNDWKKDRQFARMASVDDDIPYRCKRRGAWTNVPVRELQVGEIIQLRTGEIVPVDGYYLSGNACEISEAAMTGEDALVKKNSKDFFIFSGTQMRKGDCTMVCTSVGNFTLSGRMAMNLTFLAYGEGFCGEYCPCCISPPEPDAEEQKILDSLATEDKTDDEERLRELSEEKSKLTSGIDELKARLNETDVPSQMSVLEMQIGLLESKLAANQASTELIQHNMTLIEMSCAQLHCGLCTRCSCCACCKEGACCECCQKHEKFDQLSCLQRNAGWLTCHCCDHYGDDPGCCACECCECCATVEQPAESDDDDKTHLQKKLIVLAEQIGVAGTVLAGLTLLALLIRWAIRNPGESNGWSTEEFINLVKYVSIAITVIVVAVPEGLPLAVTISLAYSMSKMMNDNNLVRHLVASETMGAATTICSDKTGTLTTNVMSVDQAYFAGVAYQLDPMSLLNSSAPPLIDPATLPPLLNEVLRQSFVLNTEAKEVAGADAVEEVKPWNAWCMGQYGAKKNEGCCCKCASCMGDEKSQARCCFDCCSPDADTVLLDEIRRKFKSEWDGPPTEIALVQFAIKTYQTHDYEAQREASKVDSGGFFVRYPFDSEVKSMSTSFLLPDGRVRHLVKGAWEIVMAKCTHTLVPSGEIRPFTPRDFELERQTISRIADAGEGLRALGFAFVDMDQSDFFAANIEGERSLDKNLVWVGVVGIRDPLRSAVPKAIKYCKLAFVTVRMVTGDQIDTARRIATSCGILDDCNCPTPHRGTCPHGLAMASDEFTALHQERQRLKKLLGLEDISKKKELARVAELAALGNVNFLRKKELDDMFLNLKVLARSTPQNKFDFVSTLQDMDEVVAVTGDGTNDALALKQADVGFAMGLAGTKVAREASDVVLLDDNFASIVNAIMWGRNTFDSIRKFLMFQLTINIVGCLLALIGSASNGTSPLTTVQLLWLNLIMDTLGALALATDSPTRELLNREPHGKDDGLITNQMWLIIIGQSVYQLFVLLFLLYWGAENLITLQCNSAAVSRGSCSSDQKASEIGTIVFTSFVLCQVFNFVNCRILSFRYNIFARFLSNPTFICIVLGVWVVQIVIVQWAGSFINTVPMNVWPEWIGCHIIGIISWPVGVILKFIGRIVFKQNLFADPLPPMPPGLDDDSTVMPTPPAPETGHEPLVQSPTAAPEHARPLTEYQKLWANLKAAAAAIELYEASKAGAATARHSKGGTPSLRPSLGSRSSSAQQSFTEKLRGGRSHRH